MSDGRFSDWIETHLDVKSFSYREANVVCPFHQDHSPSLRINIDSGLWICHGCKEAGNVTAMANRLGLPRPDDVDVTVDELERRIAEVVDDARAGTESTNKLRAGSWLSRFLVDTEKISKFWGDQRGISPKVIKRFTLGFDVTANAATIPIAAEKSGSWYIGVVRRYLDPNASFRYMNPKDFAKKDHVLFLEQVEGSSVVVTEGPIDALKVWSAGYEAVSLFGSSMSDSQALKLKRHGISTVISFFDNDVPGIVGTKKMHQTLRGTGINHYVVVYDRGMDLADPGQLSSREISNLIRDAVPFFKTDEVAVWFR